MKKQVMGLAIAGVLTLGGAVAFAGEDGLAQRNGFARGDIFGERGGCLLEGENRDNRLEEIAGALEGVDRQDLADYLRGGDFVNVREALDGLPQEDQLEVREAMRDAGLNNRSGAGCGMGRRLGRGRK